VASTERVRVSLPPAGCGGASIRSAAWIGLLALVLQLQVGCQAATPAPLPPQASAAPAPAPPAPPAATREAPPPPQDRATPAVANPGYDLARDEARGGHTLARHVGRTDAQLRERLQREQISAASTYTDRATAERVVARTLARQRSRVDQWLARKGSRPNLALDYRGDRKETIGRSLTRRSPQTIPCSDAVVVLRWDGNRGFIVLTSYPEVSR
jgi:pyruvate/2-oxoglutarate dehydrogenase complex dihydrolipoamide acyltransferase (E2) component